LRENKADLPTLHICNSAAAVGMEPKFDMVRAGIILYGLAPSDEVDLSLIGGITPVMTLRSHVSRVRRVPAGCPVSYGGTFVTERESVIATVCAGYADGVPRLLSNRGYVIVHGVRAPIVGRVCMDQMMIDTTEIPDVRPGDVVTIFGRDGDCEISADEVAEKAGTINYEIVCGIAKRVPRVLVRGGAIVAVDNGLLPSKNYLCE
jgi:alanine racemase